MVERLATKVSVNENFSTIFDFFFSFLFLFFIIIIFGMSGF